MLQVINFTSLPFENLNINVALETPNCIKYILKLSNTIIACTFLKISNNCIKIKTSGFLDYNSIFL